MRRLFMIGLVGVMVGVMTITAGADPGNKITQVEQNARVIVTELLSVTLQMFHQQQNGDVQAHSILFVETFDPVCSDLVFFIPVTDTGVQWSGGRATIDIDSACGRVALTFTRTGDWSRDHFSDWVLGEGNCGAGEPSGNHQTSRFMSATASVVGVIGELPVNSSEGQLSLATLHINECATNATDG